MKILPALLLPVVLLAQGPDMPEGKGRDIIQRVCTKCHDAFHYATVFSTRETWEKTVDTMIQRGANVADPEVKKTIIDYLSRYFGPTVNVNDDEAADIAAKLEIAPEQAEAIVKYRMEKGDIRFYRDLMQVPGLDLSKIEPLKQRLRY